MWTVRLGLLLAGLLIALLPLEVALRVIGAAASKGPDFSRERPAFFYLPHAPTTMQGNEPLGPKAPGEYRIVVIGDSFSFAPGMQFHDAFAKRLEQILRTVPSGGKSAVSVVNLGTPGYSTVKELKSFDQALTYQPDLVLLQVTLNDPQLRPLQQEPDEIRGDFGPYKPSSWFARHSRIVSWVAARLHNTRSVASYIRYHERLWDENWDRFAQPFSTMKSEAATRKIEFGVVLFPLFDFPLTRAGYPFGEIHQKIASHVKGAGVPFIDLFRSFEGLDHYRLQLIPGSDTHPNEIAHRIAAERLYLWIRRLKSFPPERKVKRWYPRRSNLLEQQFAPPPKRKTAQEAKGERGTESERGA